MTSSPPRTAARSSCAGNSPVDRSPSAAGNSPRLRRLAHPATRFISSSAIVRRQGSHTAF